MAENRSLAEKFWEHTILMLNLPRPELNQIEITFQLLGPLFVSLIQDTYLIK